MHAVLCSDWLLGLHGSLRLLGILGLSVLGLSVLRRLLGWMLLSIVAGGRRTAILLRVIVEGLVGHDGAGRWQRWTIEKDSRV